MLLNIVSHDQALLFRGNLEGTNYAGLGQKLPHSYK